MPWLANHIIRIKKAYRRRALELHPDRNFGKEEEVTARFAEIQSAYEVLSDPQERAWYDTHESQILYGDEAGAEEAHFERNIRFTTADEITHIMGNFNSRISFSDSPTGFYGFLRETFEKLAKEEAAAAEWDSLEPVDHPSFGHKDDDYEDVVKTFYSVWVTFSTRKSFAWKDKYRYADAPDRRYRRAMEKENLKLREDGKREFNDAVRTLVAFVRKRDPRYTANAVTDAERLKTLRDAAAAQAAKQRAENEAKLKEHVLPEWAQAEEAEEVDEFDESEEEEEEQFECVACHKTFKSEKQYDAHENSKKHKKAVQTLKRQMQKENRHLNLDADLSNSGAATPRSEEEYDLIDDFESSQHQEDEVANHFDSLQVSDKNSGNVESDGENAGEDSSVEEQINTQQGDKNGEAEEVEEQEPAGAVDPELGENGIGDEQERSEPSAPKLGKAAQKRAKRAAQAAAAEKDDLKFKCATCNAGFPSKTRMFQHISDYGHAAPKQAGAKASKGKRK